MVQTDVHFADDEDKPCYLEGAWSVATWTKMANRIPKQMRDIGRFGGIGGTLIGIGVGGYFVYKTCFYTGAYFSLKRWIFYPLHYPGMHGFRLLSIS